MSAHFLVDLADIAQFSRSIQNQTISSNTDTDGTGVDMQATEGTVHLLYTTGDCGDASTVITIKAQESTDNSTFTDITGASVTLAASATANDNLVGMIKVDKRTKRYMRARVTTASGSSISVPIAVSILARKKISGSGTGTHVFS